LGEFWTKTSGHTGFATLTTFSLEDFFRLIWVNIFSLQTRVARLYTFKPKIPIWVNFGGSWYGKFYGHLVFLRPFGIFMDIWCILWKAGIFFGFLVFCTKKHLAARRADGHFEWIRGERQSNESILISAGMPEMCCRRFSICQETLEPCSSSKTRRRGQST
jgi:hypothetical protein